MADIFIPEGLSSFYAELIAQRGGVLDGAIKAAFAAVPRERFLGPGPWAIGTMLNRYVMTPSADPVFVYSDVTVGLETERSLNNGEPSFHARCLQAVGIRRGETVVHVGAGTGYFSALMAELSGPQGRVLAIEIDPALAAKAKANLEPWHQAQVLARSGLEAPFPEADVIYVNAGVSHPAEIWLDALKPGGRMLLPLTAGWKGLTLMLTARTAQLFDAQVISLTAIIPCVGGQDEEMARRLGQALAPAGMFAMPAIRSLRRGVPPDDSCWLAGDGWWLSTAPLPAFAAAEGAGNS
jgi:protein-L-isoaspartate(D-aspartate) O-methyltransferase